MNAPLTARQVKIGALVAALAIALTAAVAMAVQLAEPDPGAQSAGGPAPAAGAPEGERSSGGSSLSTGTEDSAVAQPGQPGQPARTAGFQALATARQEIIYTGRVGLRVDDVAGALRQAERVATDAGGLVAGSRLGTSPPVPLPVEKDVSFADAELVLRVPTAKFDAVMDQLGRLGTLVDRGRESQNVTEEVIDVETRVANQQRSIGRIRELLGKAQGIQDIVALESELSRREAELESLLTRQAVLKDQTALATITVSMHGEDGAGVPPEEEERGFLVGLRNGWEALAATGAVLLTVVGAALPFLIALGVLAAVPAWYAVRRRRSTQTQG